MVYCVVPRGVSTRGRRALQRTLGDHGSVILINERRTDDRRQTSGRRIAADERSPGPVERRRIQYADGRRIGERRAVSIPVAPPELPRRVRELAPQLSFLEPLEAPPEFQEDIDAVRAIVRFQAGDPGVFAELYAVWFDRVYAYLSVTLEHREEADARICAVFTEAVRALPRLALTPAQLRPWLFGLAYRAARADALDALIAIPPRDRTLDAEVTEPDEDGLEWLTDDELLLLIERRPGLQRHVLVLRYLAGLSFAEVAAIMGMQTKAAVELHRTAVRSLDLTLASVTRSPRVGGRLPMSRLGHQTPVLYRRRRALRAA